jgi:hypothetical protein
LIYHWHVNIGSMSRIKSINFLMMM